MYYGSNTRNLYTSYCRMNESINQLQVKDRMVVKTADFERQCVSPVGLQDAINTLVASRKNGRSFVRC